LGSEDTRAWYAGARVVTEVRTGSGRPRACTSTVSTAVTVMSTITHRTPLERIDGILRHRGAGDD
jgi:hypothetical protein